MHVWGGDEFVLLLNTNEQAEERLLSRLNEMLVEQIDTIAVTYSVGVTNIDPEQPNTLNTYLKQADDAMYSTKRG